MSELDGLVDGPAWGDFVGPVGGGDANEEGQMSGPFGADGVDNFEEQANAVFEAAAVVVGSLIGERGEEFVNQVAVGGVDFNEIEACGEGSAGGEAEGVHGGVDAGLVERLGDCVAGRKGDGGGGDGLPGAFFRQEEAFGDEGRSHAAFAAGVGKLNAGAGALGVKELRDALEGGDVLVFPDAEVAGGDATFRRDGGGFKGDEGGAALGSRAEVDQVPIGGEAVLRGVLAHGRNADAICELERAEIEGRKERVGHGWLDVEGTGKMHEGLFSVDLARPAGAYALPLFQIMRQGMSVSRNVTSAGEN